MRDPTLRSWTIDEHIDDYERLGIIAPPFTVEERDLARNLAAAFLFWQWQEELPSRALEGSHAFQAMEMGTVRVKLMRAGHGLAHLASGGGQCT